MKRIMAAVAAVCLVASVGWAAEGEPIDRIAAIVDNEIILESELFQYLQYNIGSQEALAKLSPAQADSLKRLILEDLIDQKVLLAKARADTLQVDAKDIDRELDARLKSLMQQAGGQERLEQYYGMPLARLKREFRPLVEQSLLIEKLKQEKMRAVQVTPSEVQKFWETYKDSIPPLKDAMRIAHVLLTDQLSDASRQATIQKADSVRKLIESGAVTFEEYASQNSDDPASKARGGKLGQTNRGDLVPEYEAAAYAMQPGEISQPVVSPFGVHLIRLDERRGEKITSSHILFHIRPTPGDTLATWQRADSIVAAVRGGADWDKLVRLYTADNKTEEKGGDLGWFAPEELPDEFKGPLADMKPGQVTEPVRTQFGVHVVRLSDRQFARPVTLADDPDRIQRMAMVKKQDEVFRKWVKELREKTYVEIKS